MPVDDLDREALPDEGDEGDAPVDPRLWFLRNPAALARRLVLAEIVAEPPSREKCQAIARRRG
jgi:hypothetical protein